MLLSKKGIVKSELSDKKRANHIKSELSSSDSSSSSSSSSSESDKEYSQRDQVSSRAQKANLTKARVVKDEEDF